MKQSTLSRQANSKKCSVKRPAAAAMGAPTACGRIPWNQPLELTGRSCHVFHLALLRACCVGQQAAHYMTKNPKQISNQHNSQYPSCLISADEQKRLPPQAPVCHLPIAPVLVSSEPFRHCSQHRNVCQELLHPPA